MWQLILAEKKAWKLKRLGYNINLIFWNKGFPGGLVVKRRPAMQETWVRSLGREDPLEKEMATHSSTLAWKIPWTEEPCKLQSMGSQKVGHDWATTSGGSVVKNLPANAGDSSYIPWSGRSPGEGNGNPLQYSCLENSMDRGTWQAIDHGVTLSQIWLSNWAQ